MSFPEGASPPYESEGLSKPVPTVSAPLTEAQTTVYPGEKSHHHHHRRHHKHGHRSESDKTDATRSNEGFSMTPPETNSDEVLPGTASPSGVLLARQQRVLSSSPLSPPTPVSAGSKWPSVPNAYQNRRFQIKSAALEPSSLPSTPRSANNSPRYRQQYQQQVQAQPQLQQQRLSQQHPQQSLYVEVPQGSHTPDEPSYDELADDFVKMLSMTPTLTPVASPTHPVPPPASPSTEPITVSPGSPQASMAVAGTFSPKAVGAQHRVPSSTGMMNQGVSSHSIVLHRPYQVPPVNMGKGRVNVSGPVYPSGSSQVIVQHPQPQVLHNDYGYAPAPTFIPSSMSPTLLSGSQKSSFLMQQPDMTLSPEVSPMADYNPRSHPHLRTVNGVVTRGRCLSQDYGDTDYVLDNGVMVFRPQVVTIPRKTQGQALVYPNTGMPQQPIPQKPQQDAGPPAIYPIPMREVQEGSESPGADEPLSPVSSQQTFGVSTPSLSYGPFSTTSSTAASTATTSDPFDPANAMGNTMEDLECDDFREDAGSSRGSSTGPNGDKEDEADGDGACQTVPFSDVDDGYYTPEEAQMYERRIEPRVESDENSSIHWQKGKAIGSGAFGTVYLGMNTDTGKLLAVKTVPIVHLDEDSKELKNFRDEVTVMRGLHHENIVKYLGMEVTSDSLNIFLEYIPCGSIASLIKKVGVLGDQIIRIYVRQILSGLMYLHNYHIVHRDIKGSNILVDHNGVIKLTDFGASKRLEELISANGSQSLKGTPNWMAPEVISKNIYCRQNDIWGVGCTIIEMATGKPPWSDHKDQMSVLFAIARTKVPPPFPDSLTPAGKEFLGLCLRVNHMERPNAATLLQHPWMHVSIKKSESPRTESSSAGSSSSTPSSTSTMTPVLTPGLSGPGTPGVTPSLNLQQKVLLTPLTSPLTCSTTSDTSPLPTNGSVNGSMIYRSGSQQFVNGNTLSSVEGTEPWTDQSFSRKLSQQQLQQVANGFPPLIKQVPSQTFSPTVRPQVLPSSQQFVSLQSPRRSIDGWTSAYSGSSQLGQSPLPDDTRRRRSSVDFGRSMTISVQNPASQPQPPPSRPIHQSSSGVITVNPYQPPNQSQQIQQQLGSLQVPVVPYAHQSRSPSPYDTPVNTFLPDSLSDHALYSGNF